MLLYPEQALYLQPPHDPRSLVDDVLGHLGHADPTIDKDDRDFEHAIALLPGQEIKIFCDFCSVCEKGERKEKFLSK